MLFASMCRAMPFCTRILKKKKNIFVDVDIVVKKHKKVKIKIWFIVVCTLIDNEYASYLFSQTIFTYCFCMLSEFAKVFREVKHDVYGKRQTAKTKLLPSVFSSLYSRIKIFVFVVNDKRHFSIFV